MRLLLRSLIGLLWYILFTTLHSILPSIVTYQNPRLQQEYYAFLRQRHPISTFKRVIERVPTKMQLSSSPTSLPWGPSKPVKFCNITINWSNFAFEAATILLIGEVASLTFVASYALKGNKLPFLHELHIFDSMSWFFCQLLCKVGPIGTSKTKNQKAFLLFDTAECWGTLMIKEQNLVTFPSLFGRHFSYMCVVHCIPFSTIAVRTCQNIGKMQCAMHTSVFVFWDGFGRCLSTLIRSVKLSRQQPQQITSWCFAVTAVIKYHSRRIGHFELMQLSTAWSCIREEGHQTMLDIKN